ncbi:hypothetical protein Tco_1570217 [Tanacetum coccineum]
MRTSKYGESNASALDDPTLQAENLVKEILLKLNLPNHRYTLQVDQVLLFPLCGTSNHLKENNGRLLASFQDLEHEGGDTRSQGGIKIQG